MHPPTSNPAVANGANNIADILAAVQLGPNPPQQPPADIINPQGAPALPNPPNQRRPERQANPQEAPRRRAPRRQPSLREQYLPAMCRLLSYITGRPVNAGNYSQEATLPLLNSITANNILRYFRFRAYGDPDANDAVQEPILRHNTVLAEKKAISFFMPTQNIPWNEVAQQGNPTRSPQVARLIANMKRFQVRRQGVPSQARRAFQPREFENMLTLFSLMRSRDVAGGQAQARQQPNTSNLDPPAPNATVTAQAVGGGEEEEEETPVETVEAVVRAPVQLAILGKCPKTLNDLWHEYMFGLTGHKPAKDFTRAERGKVRYTYARRLVFWQKTAEMVRMGYTADRAIDKIYIAYANCGSSVTKIINAMMKDRKGIVIHFNGVFYTVTVEFLR